jgi:hypothetical protein
MTIMARAEADRTQVVSESHEKVSRSQPTADHQTAAIIN